MFLKKLSLFNKLIIGLAISIVALVSLLLVSYDTSDKLYNSFNLVEHTYKVEGQLEKLIMLLIKEESDTRKYIITGDDRSLWEVKENSRTIHRELGKLEFLISDNSNQIANTQNLKSLFQKRLNLIYQAINLKKRPGHKESELIEVIQEGSAYMSQIMLLKNSMENEEETLMVSRKNEVFLHMKHTNTSIYLAGIMSLGCIILIIYILFKERQKQVVIENELKALDINKNKFFSIISHDIRNPANGIVKLIGFLKDENNSSEDTKKIILLIENSSMKLVNLVENLLNWAKLQMDKSDYLPSEFNIKEVSKQAVDSMHLNANIKGIVIENKVNDITITGDKNMTLATIRNLISNAIKFTHPKGKIILSSSVKPKFVTIVVEDTGIGMSEEIKNNLFKVGDNFSHKGTANEVGTGLGLLLCKEFMEKNKGSIAVESKINVGTKFILNFPLPLN